MKKFSCILLAAGESRRMGEVNKLLLPISGKSLVRRTAEELLKFPFYEVIVVTGHEDESIAQELAHLKVKVIHNSNYSNGMHSSIRAGLVNSAIGKTDGFMICLSDMPFFNGALVHRLADIFSLDSNPSIVFPALNGKGGHPVFISKHFIPEILNEKDGDFGCSYLFKRHPKTLTPVTVDDSSIFIDVDTPQQYQEHLKGRTI